MSDPISAFIEHMRATGCGPSGVTIEADDKPHRYHIEGDKPRTMNGSYKLKVEADGFAVGWCMSFRDAVNHPWHVKASRKYSAEDKAAWKAKADAAKASRLNEAAELARQAADKAKRLWKAASATASPSDAGYLVRKSLPAMFGARVSRGMVVVPCWVGGGLSSLQFIAPDGQKRFLRDGAMVGAYHAIPGSDVMVICEGYATGAKIHIATGYSVVCAFNAGNLKAVAMAMRGKYPDRVIMIGADNDQWTAKPDGTPYNPGIEGAKTAAVAIGGAMVVAPQIPADDPAKRTDWDDVFDSDGADTVKDAFSRANQPPQDVPEHLGDTWEPDYSTHVEGPSSDVIEDDVFSTNQILRAVRPLGRIDKTFYFFPRSCGQIMDFTGPALASMQNLVTMAPRTLWETNFEMKTSEKKLAGEASLLLIEACNQLGIYNPETERGVGVWMDDGRQVLNAGDRLFWPGGDCLPPDYKSKSVYVMGPRIGRINDDPMSNADAAEILKICLSLSWKGRLSGYMMAGWIVTAMIGGALRWRSHIVFTGEAGAGKSWVLDTIVKVILGRIALVRTGGSTEAKIRTDIGSTARPVIMDEVESETQKDRVTMEQVFMLARKASSGGEVANFNGVYPIRSAFCFAAINPRIIQGADLDRNTILHLVKNKSDSARDDFRALEKRVSAAITPEAADRLLTRTFNNLPAILKNIETFSDVLAEQEGSKRFGDQHGTLIAGAFSLTSTAEITREAAQEWCARHDWKWAKLDNDQSDGEKLLAYILAARVRHDDRGMAREASVGRLIDRALHADGLDRDVAVAALGEYGMKADRDWLYVASPSQPITHLLRETAWGGSYRRSLGELDGAVIKDNPVHFTATNRKRAVAIPMRLVIDDGTSGDVELPFDMEGFR